MELAFLCSLMPAVVEHQKKLFLAISPFDQANVHIAVSHFEQAVKRFKTCSKQGMNVHIGHFDFYN